jgi:hypothetical protein
VVCRLLKQRYFIPYVGTDKGTSTETLITRTTKLNYERSRAVVYSRFLEAVILADSISRETINSSILLDRRSKRVSKRRDYEISTRLRELLLGQLGRISTNRRTRFEYIAFGINNIITINSCLRI